MSGYIDVAIVLAYLIGTIVVGLLASRGVSSMRDYAIGNRSFTTAVLVMTLSATYIEGSDIIAASAEIFQVGIICAVAWLVGAVLNKIIISEIIAPRMLRFQGMFSVGEIIGNSYGNLPRIITGICGFLICFGFVACQIKAISEIMNYFVDIRPEVSVFISSLIVIIYSTLGGIKAVTITDVLQFFALVIAIPVIAFVALSQIGGFNGLLEGLPEGHLTLFHEWHKFNKYLTLMILYLIPLLSPPVMQRILMAKNPAQIRSSFRISAGFDIFFHAVIALIGLIAFILHPYIVPNNAFLYLTDNFLPVGIKGLSIVGVLAIIMSSADSFMNSGSVTFVHDVIKPILDTNLPDKVELLLTKLVTFTIGLSSIIMALSYDNLIELMLYSYNFWGPVVAVPLLAEIFGFKSNAATFLSAGVVACIVVVIWKYNDLDDFTGVDSLIPGLIANLSVFASSYLFNKFYNYFRYPAADFLSRHGHDGF